MVFRKDVLEETGYFLLKKTALLDTKEVRLVIDIVENDVLKPGQNIYTRKVVRFSSLISPPLWWDDVVVESLLGKYTETKFRLFMEVTGVGDLTDLSESERTLASPQDNSRPYSSEDDIVI